MKGYRHHAYIAAFAALMLLGAPGAAMAACTSPAGIAGGITWNGTDSVIWCDGTNWYALKNAAGSSGSAGYIQFSDGSGGFSNSGTTAGQQLFWDNTNKWLGVGTATPAARLHIAGNISSPAWSNNGIALRQGPATYTDTTSSGTVGNAHIVNFEGGTLAASSPTTYSNAATVSISAAPSAGTNVTITRPFALTVAGNTRFNNFNSFGNVVANPPSVIYIGGDQSAASWSTTGLNLGVQNNILTDTTGSGTIATRVANSFGQPTLASSNAVTVTNAANVYIAGAPAAGTNTTITNSNALHVAAGSSYFGGNVGIGTTTPTTPLSVSTAQGTSGGILVADATDANNPRVQLRTSNPNGNGVIEVLDSTEAVKIQLHGNGASYITSGNLGIGTTSPATSLHVSSGNAAGLIVERPATLNAGMEFRQTGGSIFAGIATGLDFAIGAGNNLEASLFKVSSAGKLKISAPDNTATQLSLISDRRAIVSTDLIGGLDFQSNDSNLTAPGTVAASIKALASATHTASELGTDLTFSTTTGTTFAERMRVTAAGNVGIGTASPSEALTVNGNPEFQGASKKLRIVPDSTGITYLQVGTDNTDATGEIRLTRYKTTSTSFAKFSSYATTNYLAGNVGIGITTPAAALHVSGTDSTAYVSSSSSAYSPADLSSPAAPMVLIANTANLDGQGVYLNLLSKNTVADGQRAYIGAISNSTGRSPNIVVGQQNGTTSYIERMRIAAGGNVGIGTTSPAAKLDVNGFMRLAKNGSAPATCDATIDGAIALTSARRMCVCDATSWVEVNSATACTW